MGGAGVTARAHVHDHDSGEGLIPLEEARERILSRIAPLPAERRILPEAHGCVTTTDVATPTDLPTFASSAMDGFAMRAEEVAGASPDRPTPLRITGRIRMGQRPEAVVGPGEAAAIPTGGAVPDGADCVIPIEACVVEGERVLVLQPSDPGKHVRLAGEDVRAGEVLIPAGRRVMAPELGLLATAGIAEVDVRPPPRVLVVSTGDELVPPGDPAGIGRVHDANAFTLYGQIREAGALPQAAGIVRDDPQALLGALASNLDRTDVLVSSGGVSVGESDPVKAAFRERGEVEFLEVAMQPGKPQAFGFLEGRPYFGLPGNPVSVFVSFEILVRPALMRIMGRSEGRTEVTAMLETDIVGPRGKVQFARVHARRRGGGWRAASTGGRQSNLMATVTRANGLAIVPAGVEMARAGEEVRVLLFREPEDG
jgi:molybdopterin molybdotransferase